MTIVWLAEEFRDEHRVTLEWQNEITDARSKFFGVERQTWENEEPDYTAQFSIISKPDDWMHSEGQVWYQIQR